MDLMNTSPWWQSAVIYQIYLRSFQDANEDGIGDLQGVLKRLDYLEWLGVDVVWLTPFFPSPMADFGYDVSNHEDVDSSFGTLTDLDQLIARLHELNIKIIIDFVAAHTSDQHAWFIESKSSRSNPKRHWYIWKDPQPDGQPPNNWIGRFDGLSAWEWDPSTQQYYLHSFLKEQPDLNWRDPGCETAMLNVIDFWLKKGVDGFRVDAAYRAYKDPEFRDNPVNEDWKPGMEPSDQLHEVFNKNVPDIHSFNKMLREFVDARGDHLLIAELYKPLELIVKHYGRNDEFHLPLNSELMSSDLIWHADQIRSIVERYEALLPEQAWPNWSLGNHDKHRVATRLGRPQARVGMKLLLTLRGTPTIYYGEELGMEDAWIPSEHIQDPWEIKSPAIGVGRDPERSPMLWNTEMHAGFCSNHVIPWLPITAEQSTTNVEVQRHSPRSFLSFTRALLALRKHEPCLQIGDYQSLYAPGNLFCYRRYTEKDDHVIALNLEDHEQEWMLPEEYRGRSTVVLSTSMDRQGGRLGEILQLRPNEGVILRLLHPP